MAEARWGEDVKTPDMDWRMSASLENVPRGDEELAEVTSLEGAVRAWLELDQAHRTGATLTPERPILIDGVAHERFEGDAITGLAERLPAQDADQA